MNQEEAAIPSHTARKSVGQVLREQRLTRGLSQEALAEALGVSARSVSRWEQDQAIPQEIARKRLCDVFGLDARSLFGAWSDEQASPVTSSLWHVPLSRNPFFTGREELLHALHERLLSEQHLALTQSWAISGLGGIGKTQIALEYAYQHARDYAAVFWINAATQETLQTGFVTLAERLHLPEKNDQDHTRVILAVTQWFARHQDWLLILDNADDVTIVQDVLPAERSGHLLLTTRAQALGPIAQQMEIGTMGMAEGTLFLLRRARKLSPGVFLDQASPEQLAAAEAIVIEMDFLPLVLDQAGAYIEEVGCSLVGYLELYRTHRAELLRRRGHLPGNYPASVATTWSLNFQQVEQANPAAAELLRLCAFLEPDTIPEELFSEGSAALSPALEQIATDAFALDGAIEELRKFSLVQRDPEAKLLRLHRLVQAVIQDAMYVEEQCQWAERAVRVTDQLFPYAVDEMEIWPRYQRFLPQAQACSVLIQNYGMGFAEAASLLHRAACYLIHMGLPEQAKYLYHQALQIWDQTEGPEQPERAHVLKKLGEVYHFEGKFEQAESLYQRAQGIWERTCGAEAPEVAEALRGLSLIYGAQGKFGQAESLCQQALRISEQALGPEHPEVARTLNNLLTLYTRQGKFEQAEPVAQRALSIQEQILGPEHPEVAGTLVNLAGLYEDQGEFEQAETVAQRALHIMEQTHGLEHPETAFAVCSIGTIYKAQKRYGQAELLLQQVLHIWEQADGAGHPRLAYVLVNLAELHIAQKRYEQAEPLYQRALHIWEQALGPEHSDVASALRGLANLLCKRGMGQQAESLYQRALSIRERALGERHLETAEILYDFAVFQEAQGKRRAAAALFKRVLSIREQVLGVEHPTTLTTRTKYLALLQAVNQEEKTPL